MPQTNLNRLEINRGSVLQGLETRERVRELRESNLFMCMSEIVGLSASPDSAFFRYSKKKVCPPNIWSSLLIKTNIAALYAAKSAQINFVVMNAKSNTDKSQLSVQDAGSFFQGRSPITG